MLKELEPWNCNWVSAVIAFIPPFPLQLKLLNTALRATETPVRNAVILKPDFLISTFFIAICKQNGSKYWRKKWLRYTTLSVFWRAILFDCSKQIINQAWSVCMGKPWLGLCTMRLLCTHELRQVNSPTKTYPRLIGNNIKLWTLTVDKRQEIVVSCLQFLSLCFLREIIKSIVNYCVFIDFLFFFFFGSSSVWRVIISSYHGLLQNNEHQNNHY